MSGSAGASEWDQGGSTGGGRSAWVVDPSSPFLATMLGGVWLGWTWYLVNGFCLEGDRNGRQYRALALGLVVACALAITIDASVHAGMLDRAHVKYVAIVLTAWKLGISYALLGWQRRDFELFAYYGGEPRNGTGLAVAGIFLRGFVLDTLLPFGWWTLVLS